MNENELSLNLQHKKKMSAKLRWSFPAQRDERWLFQTHYSILGSESAYLVTRLLKWASVNMTTYAN